MSGCSFLCFLFSAGSSSSSPSLVAKKKKNRNRTEIETTVSKKGGRSETEAVVDGISRHA